MMTRATARDIARVAGVSTSTVSHVLNGTRHVSPQLRERVIAVATTLQYEPDGVARSLRVKRSHTLGLVISDVDEPFFMSVARGVEDAARENGYSVIVCSSDEAVDREAEYLRLLIGRRVDGLILSPSGVAHEYLVRLLRRDFPLVFIDRVLEEVSIAAVLLDNAQAAVDATTHLLDLGHERIGMVAGRSGISSTFDRVSGYRTALNAAGIRFDSNLVKEGGSRAQGGRAATEELLSIDRAPTALLVGNDLMTIGAVSAIHDLGVRIGDELSVVGFDDPAWAVAIRPRLTTIAQPTYEMGRTAARLAFGRIAGDPRAASQRVVLPGRLIVRESSAPPRA